MPNMPASTPTPEAIDLEKRVKGFNGEFIPLLGKYKLGLGAQPIILPNGCLSAKPIIFDDTKKEETGEKKVEPSTPEKEDEIIEG